MSWWGLPEFRKFDIQFEVIDFDIGEEAQQELTLRGCDFVKEIKKLLSQQREATDEEAKDFERFRFLLEEKDNLKRQLPKSNDGYYSYDYKKDDTFKITIEKKTYNQKLEKVEQELKKLCKKYSFLEMPDVDYEKVVKRLSFKDFKAENITEIEENWAEYDDDEKEEYNGDFESFLKWCYEDYLESEDFDE